MAMETTAYRYKNVAVKLTLFTNGPFQFDINFTMMNEVKDRGCVNGNDQKEESKALSSNENDGIQSVIKPKLKTPKRFKITIPQPFKFMERHEKKVNQDLSHSRHLQMKQEAEERQHNEEIELLKQFRANPVPVQTFLPLYAEIMQEQDHRRQANKELFKKKLISNQKPFNLSHSKSNKRRSSSMPELPSLESPDNIFGKESKGVKIKSAQKLRNLKPFSEIKKEEAILREIRIKSRAEKLLKASSSPFSSPRPPVRKIIKEAAVQKTLGICHGTGTAATSEFTPRHSPYQNKHSFDMPSKNVPDSVLKENVPKFPEHRRRSKSCSSTNARSDPATVVPLPRMTYTARLRERAIREHFKNSAENQHLRQKGPEVNDIKKAVLISILSSPKTSMASVKKQQFRDADRARLREYQKELQEMNERIKTRPLLMERQSQLCAVQRVERQFRDRLQKQGIDEDFIFANRISHLGSCNSLVSTTFDKYQNNKMLNEHQFTEPSSISEQRSSSRNIQNEGHENKEVGEEEVTDGSSIMEDSCTYSEIPERDCS